MITDEERRRVARRMYDAADGIVWKGNSFCAMLARMTRTKKATRRDVIHRLADLIDRPTCKIILESKLCTAYGEPINGLNAYVLSCGHQTIGPERPGYCPKCGLVVADD